MRALLLVALMALVPAAVAEVHVVETVRTGDDSAPFAFSPAEITINVGDTVRWVNTDGVFHTTTSTSGLWDESLGQEGASYEHTFDEVGTFAYRCNPHATFMTGAVIVQAASTGDPADDNGAPGPALPLLLAGLVAVALRRR